MKTCPNCKTSGIPDDAQFCPNCGAQIFVEPNPWKEKYETLQKELQELTDKKLQLIAFQQAREKMYATLNEDHDFQPAMKQSAEAILKNKKGRERETTYVIIGSVCFLLPSAWAILINLCPKVYSFVGEVIAVLLFFAFFFAFAAIGLIFFNKMGDYGMEEDNVYINNYIGPFIRANAERYRIIDKGLNDEIIDPNSVSLEVSQFIEELNNQILDKKKELNIIRKL